MNELDIKIIEEFLGKTFISIADAIENSDCVTFVTSCNKKYQMYHKQDCCETVRLIDICGDISDLLNEPITLAEGVTNAATSEDVGESGTWTFYRLGTSRGVVTLRWLGESNGYYSESVYIDEVLD